MIEKTLNLLPSQIKTHLEKRHNPFQHEKLKPKLYALINLLKPRVKNKKKYIF
jgi:hypothetical protein